MVRPYTRNDLSTRVILRVGAAIPRLPRMSRAARLRSGRVRSSLLKILQLRPQLNRIDPGWQQAQPPHAGAGGLGPGLVTVGVWIWLASFTRSSTTPCAYVYWNIRRCGI